MICVTSVDTIKTPVVDVIGQLIRDVIGRLSVEPRCNWLKMTSAQVVETSVNVISNSPSQDYTHPDDRTLLYDMTPGFKPFTILTLYSFTRRKMISLSTRNWASAKLLVWFPRTGNSVRKQRANVSLS